MLLRADTDEGGLRSDVRADGVVSSFLGIFLTASFTRPERTECSTCLWTESTVRPG